MKKFLSLTVVFVLLFASCKSDDSNPSTDDGEAPLPATAEYRITFTPNFTDVDFPTDFPSNAMFTGLLIAVHDSEHEVFNLGNPVSSGMKTLAETGTNGALEMALEAMGSQDEFDFRVTSSSTSGGPTAPQSLTIVIEPEKTLLSLVAKLSPSPDWFIGVNGFNLVTADNLLVDDVTFGVGIFDAGTDSGTSYESADSPTDPAQSVSVIIDPPIGNGGSLTPSFGTIRVERIN